ncbi:MAG: hypothetical protein OHK0022_46650 [Roseiflexaceae bacterium]
MDSDTLPTPNNDAPGNLRARLLHRPELFIGSAWEHDSLHRLVVEIVRLAATPTACNTPAPVTLAQLPDGAWRSPTTGAACRSHRSDPGPRPSG